MAAANQFAERGEFDMPLPFRQEDITEIRGRIEVHRGFVFIVSDRYRFSWHITEELRGKFACFDDLKYSAIYMDRVRIPLLSGVQ